MRETVGLWADHFGDASRSPPLREGKEKIDYVRAWSPPGKATLDVASFFRDPDGGALTYTVASSAPGVVSVSISVSTLTMVGVADGTGAVPG